MSSLSLSEFADKVDAVMRQVMQGFIRGAAAQACQLSPPQFMLMEHLSAVPEAKMKDLASFMQVSTAAMTGIVERLVRDGYALRMDDPNDRRIIKVKLTAKGGRLLGKAKREKRKMLVNIFGRLSEADRADYLRILTQIKDVST